MCLGEQQVVSVSSKRCNPLMLVCLQEYGDEPPLFMDEEKQKAVSQLQEQRTQQAMSSLAIKLYRKQLKLSGMYEGSKLAIMDHYHVRLTGLSKDAFFVGLMKVSAPRGAKSVSTGKTKAVSAPAKRRKVGARVNDDDDYQMTGVLDENAPVRKSARSANKSK